MGGGWMGDNPEKMVKESRHSDKSCAVVMYAWNPAISNIIKHALSFKEKMQ